MDVYTCNISHQIAAGDKCVLEVSDARELALIPKSREILQQQKIMNASGFCNNQQAATNEVQLRELIRIWC